MTEYSDNATLQLRDLQPEDLEIFFQQQLNPDANYMAAFTSKDPTDHAAFTAHWNKILADKTILIKTVLYDGQVAGSVSSYRWSGDPEVTYWLGKEFWGKGIATWALAEFLVVEQSRPIYARVAKDNLGLAARVLQKNGFEIVGEDKGFANARGQDAEEYMLVKEGEV